MRVSSLKSFKYSYLGKNNSNNKKKINKVRPEKDPY